MIVAGRVSQKMAPVLRQIYDQMSEPKWVISMGVCASSGGMFNNYAIVQGVDHIVPVDIYLPGCPPRPEMLIDAIVKLHDKIQNMKLGVNREREVTELEEARLRRLPLAVAASAGAGQAPVRRLGRHEPAGPLTPSPRAGRHAVTGPDEPKQGDSRAAGSTAVPDPAALAGRERLAEQVPADRHVRHLGRPATPPATAACRSAGRRGSPARGRTAPTSTRSPTRWPARSRPAAPASATPSSRWSSPTASSPSTCGASTCSAVASRLRDDPALAFEMCLGVSGVHYPADAGEELHAVYHLLSITHNRRLRLEVTAPDADPHVPVAGGRLSRPATSTSARPGTSSASSSTATRR